MNLDEPGSRRSRLFPVLPLVSGCGHQRDKTLAREQDCQRTERLVEGVACLGVVARPRAERFADVIAVEHATRDMAGVEPLFDSSCQRRFTG